MAETTIKKPTLQHLNNSQSQQILWLLEELDIPYDINFHERIKSGSKKHRAPDSLKETHPLGKSPQLITAEGRVIAERGAIALYLIETYDKTGKFRINPANSSMTGGKEPDDYIREAHLLSLGDTSLNPVLMVGVTFEILKKATPLVMRALPAAMSYLVFKGFVGPEIDNMLKYFDDNLEGREETFIMGTADPTRVDFAMQWYIDMGQAAGLVDLSKYSRIQKWFERCTTRPAWKRALEKGNGYNLKFM